MKLVEKAKYKNTYIVAVTYVYGDGDRYETKLCQCDTDKDVYDFYHVLNNLPDELSEEDMKEYLKDLSSKGIQIEEDSFWYDYDYCFYADYESMIITYYDENGYGHHMEIEE